MHVVVEIFDSERVIIGFQKYLFLKICKVNILALTARSMVNNRKLFFTHIR